MRLPVSDVQVLSQPSAFRRFAVAVVLAAIATALRFYINPLLGNQSPFLFYAIGIAVSAQYGGTIPGLITTALSFVLSYAVFTVPAATAHLTDSGAAAGLLVVLSVGVFLSFFFGRRRRAEEEVLRVHYNLETAQHIANVGSWESDLITGRLWWSAETRNIFGIGAGQPVTAEDFYRLVHPEDRDRVREHARIAVMSRQPYNVEHRIVVGGGDVRHVHQIAKVLSNNHGAPVLLIGSIQDITGRKRAEQEIRVLQGLLPICSNCKKIRDDKADGQWSDIEAYVRSHSEATFTHGICPTCMKQLYGPDRTEDAGAVS